MNEHKPCCDRCLPHTKLGECYNPSCSCHQPDEPKAWRGLETYIKTQLCTSVVTRSALKSLPDDTTKDIVLRNIGLFVIDKYDDLVSEKAETAQRARAEAIRECVTVLGQSDHPMIVAAIKALNDKLTHLDK